MAPPPRRCAVYTRKSSDEGLEQDFNSLHAQREACEAYVRSQKGEGWRLLPAAYDDGAYSGGTMERPALKRLLADVAAGKVDVVVVYKVDRLTRSLADFAKIVEIFDARGVSFVSVTQAFNTTTSMGRLTLNVLLSFAQFEREVTGERIRDKIAASKAKGMWMGGVLSLGYDVHGRTLVINPQEAELVRRIFQRYLEVDSVRTLALELDQAGVRSKVWTTRAGQVRGGVVMGRGALFHILSSRLYVGEIVHKGKAHRGQHPAIISRELFEAVAAKLASLATQPHRGSGRASSCLFTGRLFDGEGRAYSPSFAYGKRGRLYKYYILMPLQVGKPCADAVNRRISAPALENFVLQQLCRLTALEEDRCAVLVRRVEIFREQVHIDIDAAAIHEHEEVALALLQERLTAGEMAVLQAAPAQTIKIVLPAKFAILGGRSRVVGANATLAPHLNTSLAAALKKAHLQLHELGTSPLTSRSDQSEATAPETQHLRHLCRLAFLAPHLQRRIMRGEQGWPLSAKTAIKIRMPLAWADQDRWIERHSARSRMP